ncbi:MAG: hypothetical protein KDC79_00360 [Cyclobacteriaceae bacterium]|nr:hypothetical protein [Cyclobacteriaceae bacterium]
MKYAFLLFAFALGSCQIIFYDDDPSYWDDRDLIVGFYKVDEYSETTDEYFNYEIDIVKSCCNDNEVLIRNFYDVDLEVYGYFSGYKLTIPRQYIGRYEIEGTGRMENSHLNMSYVVRNPDVYPASDFLSATAWRVTY